ncbi:hypothetical protein T4C_7352, partial [Trichinella pseudospiralis]
LVPSSAHYLLRISGAYWAVCDTAFFWLQKICLRFKVITDGNTIRRRHPHSTFHVRMMHVATKHPHVITGSNFFNRSFENLYIRSDSVQAFPSSDQLDLFTLAQNAFFDCTHNDRTSTSDYKTRRNWQNQRCIRISLGSFELVQLF